MFVVRVVRLVRMVWVLLAPILTEFYNIPIRSLVELSLVMSTRTHPLLQLTQMPTRFAEDSLMLLLALLQLRLFVVSYINCF